MIHGYPASLHPSLVWVSFRSHGWLQHGRRPEGACRQHTSRLPGSGWHLVSSPSLQAVGAGEWERKPQAEAGTAPFVRRVPWPGPTYFVFQSSFLHSVGWKIHVWWVQTRPLHTSCLRMPWEEEGHECKVDPSLPPPPQPPCPLLNPHFESEGFCFF